MAYLDVASIIRQALFEGNPQRARCLEMLARVRRCVRDMEAELHPNNRLLAESRDVLAR
jgi:hypothetical protein